MIHTVTLQYSLINVGISDSDIEHLQETVVVVMGKRFSKHICRIICRRNPINCNSSRCHEFSNVMVTNIDMLDLAIDATPNGLAMNLPILHDISCISYKDL